MIFMEPKQSIDIIILLPISVWNLLESEWSFGQTCIRGGQDANI